MKHPIWRLRNPWTWPGLFEIGCWWEKRYRPERSQWKEGAILLPAANHFDREERRP